MTDADLALVCDIEKSAYEFPWSENIFKSCLSDGYYAPVMVDNETIIAYGVIFCAVGEAHILNLCVRPVMHRQGLGRSMLMHLLMYARHVKVGKAFLEVRRSNKAAIELYNRVGFREAGLRKGYYPVHQGREDAVVMTLELEKLLLLDQRAN